MIYISQLLETPRLIKILEEYAIGLEVISFSIGYVLDDLETSIKHYQKAFLELPLGTPLTFHGPFLDLLPGSCDAKVQALVKERFEAAYEAALSFGVNQMIFHTGYMPNTYPDQYWLQNVIDFWRAFLKDKPDDFTVYIENVLDLDWKLMQRLIDEINHPSLKICLDVGHVHAYSPYPIEEWIEALGERIGYVHLHNNDKSRDAHGGLLEGTIPMKMILKLLKEKAPHAHWSLEVSDEQALRASLDWLVHNKLMSK